MLHHTIPEQAVNLHTNNLIGMQLGSLFRFGQEAVILFFILSGFVINYSFTRSRDKTLKTYFLKRALRIYIPLLIVFLMSYLLSSHNARTFIDPELKTLGLNLLMLQDWEKVKPNVITPTYMGNTPLWSLSYEWWFYMLYFPLVKYVKDKLNLHLFVYLLAAASSIIYIFYPYALPRLIAYFAIWWTGVFLSDLYIDRKLDSLRNYMIPIIGLTIPLTIISIPIATSITNNENLSLGTHPFLEFRHFSFALLVLIGSYIWRSVKWKGFNLIVKPFLFMAPFSYVLYISHYPLMVGANYLNIINHSQARWLCYLMIVFTFSWIVEILIYDKIRKRFS